jgi:hypothetical protein
LPTAKIGLLFIAEGKIFAILVTVTDLVSAFDGLPKSMQQRLILGIALKLRVIRDGIELVPVMKDDHYDFSYQNPILLSNPLVIQPVRCFGFFFEEI